MTEKEIKNFGWHHSQNAEDQAEMNRVKEQLLRRLTKVMRTIVPPKPVAKIPEKLIPRNMRNFAVMDVVLLKGEKFHRLIVDPHGVVIGRENPHRKGKNPGFEAENVYAVRVRSGFFGRIGLTFWRNIYD